MRYFVVGAGITGLTIAERIANDMKEDVLVIEKRDNIGGNAYSYKDNVTGIECHKYGAHIFHTKKKYIWDYITRFSEFTNYRHRVLTCYKDKIYPMPINLMTINMLFGEDKNPYEVSLLMNSTVKKYKNENPKNLEEYALSLVGERIYEAFIKNYTIKQWGKDPKELPASILKRLPFRKDYYSDYFDDAYQGMPLYGYDEIFLKMTLDTRIHLLLNCDYKSFKDSIPSDAIVIYTGLPDELLDYKYGALEWRSLDFVFERKDIQDFQGNSVINYADLNKKYTRIHEFKHFYREREMEFNQDKTVICYEYPKKWKVGDEAFYPIADEKNLKLYELYKKELTEKGIILCGRLGSYQYLNMDQAIDNALGVYIDLCNNS